MKEKIPTLKLDCEKILTNAKNTQTKDQDNLKFVDDNNDSNFLNSELESIKSEIEALKVRNSKKKQNIEEKFEDLDSIKENISKNKKEPELNVEKVKPTHDNSKQEKLKVKEESNFFKRFIHIFKNKE